LRGRGDAVGELTAMPRAEACRVLLACLCTHDADCGLVLHVDGYAELVVLLRPDPAPWFAWVRALPPDAEEDELLYPFHLLGDVAHVTAARAAPSRHHEKPTSNV
jgi:hypothetical protein